jgi:signal transduction histidine kinase
MAADARQTGRAADSLKKEKKSASHKWPPADLVPDVEVADKFVNEHADQIVNAFARMLQLQNTVIDQENKINVVQSRQKRLLLWYTFLTIGALFVIVCLSSLLLYYRQRRKLHQKEMEQEKLNAYINGLEADRTLVAKELHDNITNRLLIVQHAVAPYADLLPANINDELNGLYTEVRDLSHELQPPMFGYATLPDAIHSHVSKLNAASITRFALHLNNADDFKPLPENYSLNVYRIVQEATNNIVKHAHANRVDISLSIGNNHLYLLIQDDGIGISPETLRTGTGIGLHLMRERTNQLQGVLELVRSEEEQGSVLRFSAPLPKETETAAGG